MASKFDAESVLEMIYDIMTTGGALNAKIAAIEVEKGAMSPSKALTPTLAPIPASAYFEQTWNDKILNMSPAILYGIEDVTAQDGGGAVAKTYKCFVEIILVDSGQKADAIKRILRYTRALEELFVTNFSTAIGSTIKIDTLRPVAFKLEMAANSEEIKVGGISLTVTLV